ncbi:MAG: hypothetical protein ACQET0_03110 [Pseudomonadota bacterium]
MNLYSALVAVVAIWAVVKVTQHWLAARGNGQADAEAKQRNAEIDRLEARVRTLERIVTDDRESLARRIDDLE